MSRADALTNRDPSKANAQQGLYHKFDVRRVDESDQPGGKHHDCEYFVLDLNHDGYARAALRAYARACAAEFPVLATDLIARYALAPVEQPAAALPQPVLDALRFYANGSHFNIDNDHQDFDTVSGEPVNWLYSMRDDDTTMIEDGSIAKAALCGKPLGFEDPESPVEGEVFGARPAAAQAVVTELARMTRMFHAACYDLGLINEALGLDPADGGAAPILEAITGLKAGGAVLAAAQADERAAFLTWWCEDVPESMREGWKEGVDECLRRGQATDKLAGAWDGFQFGVQFARAILAHPGPPEPRAEVTDDKTARLIKTLSDIIHDQTVAMQSAIIEWQHGEGAEAGLSWIVNTLEGPGHLPDFDAPHGKHAQFWFNANQANPLPMCFCGNPSSSLWMGQGFCCDEHYREAKAKHDAARSGATHD
ncbi:hypothetical protein WL19_03595 [Burkholderia ubonensis]|nr:hypothetical protein WL19_03595 [Burkholderia ubonensis]